MEERDNARREVQALHRDVRLLWELIRRQPVSVSRARQMTTSGKCPTFIDSSSSAIGKSLGSKGI
jgi:hypothetical protein